MKEHAEHAVGKLTAVCQSIFKGSGPQTALVADCGAGLGTLISEDTANADRLVACWNDCEGIEDPAALRAQRDAAVGACKGMLDDMEAYGMDTEGYHESMNAGRAAIAKATP